MKYIVSSEKLTPTKHDFLAEDEIIDLLCIELKDNYLRLGIELEDQKPEFKRWLDKILDTAIEATKRSVRHYYD